MIRAEIEAIVKKHLMEVVDDLKEEDIDTAKSMKYLGANSLDIVEVVSCSMRELKVKVPRSDLSKLTDINSLVDLLHLVTVAKDPAA